MKLSPSTIRPKVLGLALALSLALSLAAGSARAADDDYCQKTRARAGSDAALLYAPSARVSGVKIPQTGAQQVDPTNIGTTYQVRAELQISPTDAYKGSIIQKAADADCDAHRVTVSAQELLVHAGDIGRMTALREEMRFLDAQKPGWDAIGAKMQERLDAKTATIVEVEDVKTRIVMLERQRAQARGDMERLAATGFDTSSVPLTGLAEKVEGETNRLERELVKVRSIDPWNVSVSAGYVPPVFTKQNDWYGVVQLTYNFGGPWHGSRDTRYLEARENELKTARYELPHQIDVLKKNVTIASTQARTELDIVNARMAEVVDFTCIPRPIRIDARPSCTWR